MTTKVRVDFLRTVIVNDKSQHQYGVLIEDNNIPAKELEVVISSYIDRLTEIKQKLLQRKAATKKDET